MALRLIQKLSSGIRAVNVFYADGLFKVRFYVFGVHRPDKDSEFPEQDLAIDAAKALLTTGHAL